MAHDPFGEAIGQAHAWVAQIADSLDDDKDSAYRALRATMQALRDRVTVETAAHLSAQLPLLIRGIFFEGWDPSDVPVKMHADDFIARVRHDAVLDTDDQAKEAIRAVVEVMWKHLTPGALEHLGAQLPVDMQPLIHR
jgi:uncharacterized protein (DUF2267 family)